MVKKTKTASNELLHDELHSTHHTVTKLQQMVTIIQEAMNIGNIVKCQYKESIYVKYFNEHIYGCTTFRSCVTVNLINPDPVKPDFA
jgi:hypothetical protein